MSISKKLQFIVPISACLLAAGCTSNGNGADNITGSLISDTGGGFPIGGGGTTSGTTGGTTSGTTGGSSAATPTSNVTDGGTGGSGSGSVISGNFVCTNGIALFGDATTEVGANGLLGGPLTDLLNALGGNTATELTNSVVNPQLVIDGNLSTYASFNLTAGLIGTLVDSLDESVILSSGKVPAGNYAVFAVTFPAGAANVSLFNGVKITTFLGGTQQETRTVDQSQISLITSNVLNTLSAAYIGFKATKDYDTAQISLVPGIVSASVGDAMRVHELCAGGHF